MPTTTNYIWDANNYLAESDATNSIAVVYTNEPEDFGNLISTRYSSNTSYYHFDATESTRQLSTTVGQISDRAAYDAWGIAVIRDGTTPTSLLWNGAIGYYTVLELAIHYVRQRIYLPTIARWTALDALRTGSETNLYQYVVNTPVFLFDPSGMAPAKKGDPCHPCSMKCGPDVYKNLLLTLTSARAKMQNFSAFKRWLIQRKLATFQIGYNWDILGMTALESATPIGVKNPCYALRRGTVCETCVEVKGNRHDLWEVNYALFGLICAEIGWSFGDCGARVLLWKSYKRVFSPEPSSCRPKWQWTATLNLWLKFGYEFSEQFGRVKYDSLLPPIENDRFEDCDDCMEPPLPTEVFDYQLLEDFGGDETGFPP